MQWIDIAETLSKQRLTSEGYLACDGCRIARVGVQRYHISELPAGVQSQDGWVDVDRPESEVFSPAAIASFRNVPVTRGHPPLGVSADNWREYAVGYVTNPRRAGSFLAADLVVTDRPTVSLIRDRGWKALSCGYDATYIPTGIGRARQTGIRGNHLAILNPSESARCGDACRINDSTKGAKMTTKDEHGYFVSGAVPSGEAGSQRSYGLGQMVELVRWENIPAASVQVLSLGNGGTRIVYWPNERGEGMGGKPIGDATAARLALSAQTRPRMAEWQRRNDAAWGKR
jgi:hypothetical protein